MEAKLQPQDVSEFDVSGIMEMIPHRYPFLMVDRIIEARANYGAIGLKNVSMNEHYFAGHFPAKPVMPGVLIIEALAQTAAVLVVHTLGPGAMGKLVYFMSVESARFRHPVVPGDQLELHVLKERSRGTVWKFSGEARVSDRVCAEAVFTAMILDPPEE